MQVKVFIQFRAIGFVVLPIGCVTSISQTGIVLNIFTLKNISDC